MTADQEHARDQELRDLREELRIARANTERLRVDLNEMITIAIENTIMRDAEKVRADRVETTLYGQPLRGALEDLREEKELARRRRLAESEHGNLEKMREGT